MPRVTGLRVVTAADDAYRPQAEVLVRSLALSQTGPTCLTVLGTGWTSAQESRLAEAGLGRLEVEVIEPIDPRAAQVPVLRHGFPPAATYSVLAAELSQFDRERRIVYLDADTIVRDPLHEIVAREMTCVFAFCRMELSQKPAKKLIALRSDMSTRAPASRKSGRQPSVPGTE